MKARCFPLWAFVFCVTLPCQAEEPDALGIASDEKLLQQAGLSVDGPSLLAYLRSRMPQNGRLASNEECERFVRLLGSDDFADREKASTALIKQSGAALPALQKAENDADAEVRRRARACREAIINGQGVVLSAAVARLLRVRRPQGACEVLLAFLPFAAGDETPDEILGSLVVLGVNKGQVDPHIVKALNASHGARQAAAALVLGRWGNEEQKRAVGSLLQSPNPEVRLRAAHGLLASREKRAIPTLIDLLAETPLPLAEQAEDLLFQVGGEGVPKMSLGKTTKKRQVCRANWQAWWKAKGSAFALPKSDMDLVVINASRIARTTAQEVLEAMFVKGNVEVVRRSTTIPFVMPGWNQSYKSRDELDNYVKTIASLVQQLKIKIKFQETVTLAEHARRGRAADIKELGPLSNTHLRVVYFDMEQNGGNRQIIAAYVRLRGRRATVIGLGRGPDVKKAPK